MDRLPVPKCRAAWLAALILTVISFPFYYLHLYPDLNKVYQEHFWNNGTYSNECKTPTIRVRVPGYVSDFVEREIEISFENPCSTTIPVGIFVVSATLVDSSQNKQTPLVYILDKNDDDTIEKSRGIIFYEGIPAHAIFTYKLWLKVQEGDDGNYIQIHYYLDDTEIHLDSTPSLPVFNRSRTLLHSFIQTILMPPWSNGFLLILSLFSAWLLQKRLKCDVNLLPGLSSKLFKPLEQLKRGDATKHLGHQLESYRGNLIKRMLFSIRSWVGLLILHFGILCGGAKGITWISRESAKNFPVVGVILGGIVLFMGVIALARWVAGAPEQISDDFFDDCAAGQDKDAKNASKHDNGGESEEHRPLEPVSPLKAELSLPDGAIPVRLDLNGDWSKLVTLLQNASNPSSLDMLWQLQHQHQTLPEFEKYYVLLKPHISSSWELLLPLAASVEATRSEALDQCTDGDILDGLLELTERCSQISFQDQQGESGLFDALLEAGHVHIDEALVKRLQKGGKTVDLLLRQFSSSSRKGDELLSLFNEVPHPEKGQWLSVLNALTPLVDNLRDAPHILLRFLEKGRNIYEGPLSAYLSLIETQALLAISEDISGSDPSFAEWFIYKELPYLPSKMDDELISSLQEICLSLQKPAMMQMVKDNTSPTFLKLVDNDWKKSPPAMPKDQPEIISNRLANILLK